MRNRTADNLFTKEDLKSLDDNIAYSKEIYERLVESLRLFYIDKTQLNLVKIHNALLDMNELIINCLSDIQDCDCELRKIKIKT